MGIQADRWITRMALEKGMIEPFEGRQMREGVISYGVSSYGYDMRVAREFKIFTNVLNSIVDPKNFDPRSFVEFEGDVCIVPPNSFALARSVEYFRIPRDVVTVCVGKSTYARCFSGDTRVALVDGTAPTLEELTARAALGEVFWGYSLGEYGRIIVTQLEAPRFVARDALLELVLDDGAVIRATPDHGFIRRDGQVTQAADLRPGDSLMPLYRELLRGYESVYQPLNGHLIPTHRLADEWNVRHGLYGSAAGTHRHHRDHDRRNNCPWNIERMPAGQHIAHHNAQTFGEDFDPEEHSGAIRSALASLSEDPVWRSNYSTVQRARAHAFWTDTKYAESRQRLLGARLASWTTTRRAVQSAAMTRHYADHPETRRLRAEQSTRAWARDDGSRRSAQRDIARAIRIRPEITADAVREAFDATGSIRGAARVLGCDRSVFRRFRDVVATARGTPAVRNHKIAAIRDVPGDHDVYCLTVPEAGNFALAAGVFVENCGIITNVTPFEPEWEGFVTLEISNTTPLPAKIYANEGIAQVLFFKGDEPPEISYADKKGKYQGQRGVTLPKL
jgi:deoxycytidine triphosphate deaminase